VITANLTSILSNLNIHDPFVLLEDRVPSGEYSDNLLFSEAQYSILANNKQQLQQALEQIESAKKQGFFLCGYIAYEAGYHFINDVAWPTEASNTKTPLVYFIAFKNKLSLTQDTINNLLNNLISNTQDEPTIVDLHLNQTKEKYFSDVNTIKMHILNGDSYQINYTMKYKFDLIGTALNLYNTLRELQKVKYTAYLNFPNNTIVSLSPELFIQKKGLSLLSQPIKGTAQRGNSKKQDQQIIHWLQNDSKTLSENMMIVDLIRNDFGKICDIGSIKAFDLFKIETLPTLHQMVSSVSGQIAAHVSLKDILQSLFPCGSITAAPKIKTMTLIQQLEQEARGIYTGAIGYIQPDGDFCFNVPIRTITIDHNNHGELGIGSGIVHESDAEAEYQECLLKAKFLTNVNQHFALIETFSYCSETAIFHNLPQHLARLTHSAHYFGFALDVEKLQQDLAKLKTSLPHGKYKIKIQLSQTGSWNIQHQLITTDNNIKKIKLSQHHTQSQSVFLYHKTTKRTLYEQEYQLAQQQGFYDVIFLNEYQQITEASRHNIFIKKNNIWHTAPLSCGLLNGIYRQQLLDKKQAQESILTLDDLKNCQEIALTNSVRGFVSVTLVNDDKDQQCSAKLFT
jgi:para-aminobenzoate synthetase / 4-amino-4-deoxychorismate lyase